MRGAAISYNGIQIALTHINDLITRPVYTDDGIDYLYTEVTLDIVGILNPAETSYGGNPAAPVPLAGQLPNTTFNAISLALKSPRGTLILGNYIGGTVFQSPEPAVTPIVDSNGGPFPQECAIQRFDGAQTWTIHYVIKTFINECPSSATYLGVKIISNRFGQAYDIDRNHYTTILTAGTASFDMAILKATGVVADAMRSYLVPAIPPGFRRESLHFNVDSKLNEISYTVMDRELPFDLGDTGPQGSGSYITDANIVYSQSTMAAGGAGPYSIPMAGLQIGMMSVKLWGSKVANIWNMTQIAFGIMATSKIGLGNPKKGGIVRGLRFTQSMTERYVECVIEMNIPAQDNGPFGVFAVDGLSVASLPSYDGINPVPENDGGTRGTADIVGLAADLKAACGKPQQLRCYSPSNGGYTPASALYCGPAAVTVGASSTYVRPSPSKVQKTNAPFTQSSIRSKHDTFQGIIQSPIGAPSASYTPGGGGQATPTPTCSILTVAPPMSRRTVEWVCESFGAPPQIPSPILGDQNQVLIDWSIVPDEVSVLYDGVTPLFRCSGRYVYALATDLATIFANGGGISYDVAQWVSIPYGTYGISNLSFQNGNIDSNIT